jgi:hypothetical protein
MGDIIIQRQQEAQEYHNSATAANKLMLWVVYDHPSDYPQYYAARPWTHDNKGNYRKCDIVILASTINSVRNLLPHGLFRIDKQINDPHPIVEIWL